MKKSGLRSSSALKTQPYSLHKTEEAKRGLILHVEGILGTRQIGRDLLFVDFVPVLKGEKMCYLLESLIARGGEAEL